MTKGELIKAMEDFPDDMPVRISFHGKDSFDDDVRKVTEICPTGTGTSENYLLIS